MALNTSPGFVYRSRLQTGDPIRALKDASNNFIQVVALSDEDGAVTGTPANPLHIEGAILSQILTQVTLGAAGTVGGATSVKQDTARAILENMLTELEALNGGGLGTSVIVTSSALPTGASTESTLQNILDELEQKANLSQTQPVSISGSVTLPTGAATEVTQNLVLDELRFERTIVKLYDEASSTVTYVGEALSGVDTDDAAWSIKKIATTGNITSIYRASDGAFEEVWDDRASLTYA